LTVWAAVEDLDDPRFPGWCRLVVGGVGGRPVLRCPCKSRAKAVEDARSVLVARARNAKDPTTQRRFLDLAEQFTMEGRNGDIA
jgi:hypothetical protein